MNINKETAMTAIRNVINHKSLSLNRESFIILENVMVYLQNNLPEPSDLNEITIPEENKVNHE